MSIYHVLYKLLQSLSTHVNILVAVQTTESMTNIID